VPRVAAHERTGVLPLLLTVSYLGLGVPAMAAGFIAVRSPGLIGAARYYGAALIVLALLARSGRKGSAHDHVCHRPEHRLR
jgi:hypothetical protein